MDVRKALDKELAQTVKPYLDQIKDLEDRAAQKRQTVQGLQQEVAAKSAEAEQLKNEARNELGRGGDPRPILSQAAKAKEEAEQLAEVMTGADPDKEEKAQIRTLKSQLYNAVHERIRGSKALQTQSEAFLQALRDVVDIVQGWDEAVKSLCDDLKIEFKQYQLLEFRDGSEPGQLAQKIQKLTDKHQHLFNRRS